MKTLKFLRMINITYSNVLIIILTNILDIHYGNELFSYNSFYSVV